MTRGEATRLLVARLGNEVVVSNLGQATLDPDILAILRIGSPDAIRQRHAAAVRIDFVEPRVAEPPGLV